MVGFIVAICLVILIVVTVSVLAVKLWLFISRLSLAFARAALSLFIASGQIFSLGITLSENRIVNILLRFVIIFGFIYLVSFIPRVGAAIGTFCSCVIGMATVVFGMSIGGVILTDILKPETPYLETLWFNLIMGAVLLFEVLVNFINDIDDIKAGSNASALLDKPILVRIGRVIASFIYGVVFFFIIYFSFRTVIDKMVYIQYLLLIGCMAAAYIADLFLLDRASPPRSTRAAAASGK